MRGDAEAAAAFAAEMHLALPRRGSRRQGEETLFNRRSGLAEVVIPPRSGLIGQTVFPGMVTESGDLIILAVQRAGAELAAAGAARDAGGDRAAGRRHDAAAGNMEGARRPSDDPDVLVVNSPELVRRQAVPMGPGARQAVAILVAMVVLLATGIVPPAVAGLLAAGAIVLSGIMTRRAGLSRDRLDDGDSRRRDDAAVDCDGRDGRREADGRRVSSPSSATPVRSPCSPACSC